MQKKYQYSLCQTGFFLRDSNRFVFLLPTESSKGPEALAEKPKIIPFEAHLAFDSASPLNRNIINLMRSAMGEDYRDFVTVDILKNLSEDKFPKKQREAFRRMQLQNGTIYFFDEKGKTLALIDVSKELREIVDDYGIDQRSNLYRRARNQRLYYYASHATFRDPNYPYLVGRETQGAPKRAPAPALNAQQRVNAMKSGNRPPLTKDQEAVVAEIRALYASRSVTRRDILSTVEHTKDPNYDIPMNVDRTLCDSNGDEFFVLWREMEHFSEIDALFEEEAQSQEGYMVNPLKEVARESGKNYLEVLRNLIQHRYNHRIYLKEVLDLVYTNRFDTFKKNLLQTYGIPKELVDLLDKDCVHAYRFFKDLSRKFEYKEIERIPANLQKLEPHKDKLKVLVAILGDYLAYSTRLIQLVDQLTYKPAQEQKEHSKLMFERRDGTSPEALAANKVIDSLTILFRNADEPTVYTSELRHLFAGWSEREITFQDLNGNVMSAEPLPDDWFTMYQSGETAYKMVFENSEKREKNPDGSYSTKIDELAAKKTLNDLLQVGITAYPALPVDDKESLKSIIDGLARVGVTVEAGIPLRFTGNLTVDAQNLASALALNDLSDVREKKSLGSKKERLVAAARAKFIRIGSVIRQKELAKRQERESREAPRTACSIKFRDEHAEEIAGWMRATKKFTDRQIGDFKRLLICGGAVVLPDHGGGFSLNFPFENGISIKIAGFLENWKGGLGGGGAMAVGYNFETSNTVSVSLDLGAGFSVLGGPFVGTSGRVTKKFSSVDFYVEGGGGFLFGPMVATGFVGLGLDWAKYKENYQRILQKEHIEHHIAELGENPYEKVKANPGKYPELSHILYQLKNTGLPLDAASEKDVFNGIYEVFREGIQNKAVDRSVPVWWKRFLPTEIGLGLALFQPLTGQPPVSVPYLKLSFALWKRTIVYRLATNPRYIKQLAEDQAQQAIFESLAKSGHKIEQAKQMLRTGTELMFDPKSGELMLRASREGKIDFSFIDERDTTEFERMRKELAENADIFVDPTKADAKGMGLVLLSPQKAHGDVFMYIDPALKEHAIVVTRDDKLYLAVKKGTGLYFKREDITYPFKVSQYQPGGKKKRKEKKGIPIVEDTFIYVSNNPWRRHEVIQANSESFLMKRPGSDWVQREGVRGRTSAERLAKKQSNIQTWETYRAYVTLNKPTDRIEFEASSSRREAFESAYRKLAEVTELEERERDDPEIDEEKVKKIITTLTSDTEFMSFYKLHWTRGYPVLRSQKEAFMVNEFGEKFGELIKHLNEKAKQPLTPLELDAILLALFIYRLSDLPENDKAPAAFEKKLREVFTPILTAMFTTYYKGRPDRDQKVKAAVEYTLNELKTADIRKEKAKPIDRGALFGTLVGTLDRPKGKRVFGMASFQNFRDSGIDWGMLGMKVLDPTRQDIAGEIGRFWLDSLSPYKPDLQNKPVPRATDPEYRAYQEQMYANLKSRLALRLRPLITLVLEPHEIDQLTEIYAGGHTVNGEKLPRPRVAITGKNIATVRKFLNECDKVRAAELRGEKEVKLSNPDFIVQIGYYEHKKSPDGKPLFGPDGEPIRIFHHVGAQVFHGIYKKCGNPSGLLLEEFRPVYVPESTRPHVYAGKGQVIHDVRQFQGARIYHLNLGFASPFEAKVIEPTRPTEIPPPPPGPTPEPIIPPTAWRPPPPTGTRPDIKFNAPEEQPNEGI